MFVKNRLASKNRRNNCKMSWESTFKIEIIPSFLTLLYTETLLSQLMQLEQFQMGEIPDKPNIAGSFRNLCEKGLKHHYVTPKLLYCCVLAVWYRRRFQIRLLQTYKCNM